MIRVIFSDKDSGTVSDEAQLQRQIDLGTIAAYCWAEEWVPVARSHTAVKEESGPPSVAQADGGAKVREYIRN